MTSLFLILDLLGANIMWNRNIIFEISRPPYIVLYFFFLFIKFNKIKVNILIKNNVFKNILSLPQFQNNYKIIRLYSTGTRINIKINGNKLRSRN